MALEFIADRNERLAYPIAIEESTLVSHSIYAPAGPHGPQASPRGLGLPNATTRFSLNPQEMLELLLRDRAKGVPPPILAARFHNALAETVAAVANKVGMSTVALTGGCFQNRLLTHRCRAALANQGHRVLVHRQVPPNDGGLALGQLAVACSLLCRN
jgi:hydrogenase maturation protein HypF